MRSGTADKVRDIVGRLPTTRNEDWKYTDLTRARDISTRWLDAGAQTSSASPDASIDAITGRIDAAWCVFANGRLLGLPDGLDAERIGGPAAPDDALAELNAALLVDGLRIRVSGQLEKPIGLLFIDSAGVSQGYVEIEFAAGSAGEIVEYHAAEGDEDHYANTIVTLDVGASATVRHLRIQDRGFGHVQTGSTAVSVGRDARFTSASFDLGGGLIRNDLRIDIASPGAEVAFDGLYLAGDGQHIDNHTRVDHRVGPAISRQEYRGILNGRCRCVWNGKAIVHEGADGTDADQANHNLLLSTKAEIDAKPELEIYTDDVKCSHGTTVGQLDESSLFYLRSRGLDKRHATQVLTHAFAAGLVSRVPVSAAVEAVAALMEARLAMLVDDAEDFSV
ncbi:MAG: Fe-S cluster assembly protein SufD [Gammaproteobacteria bacterium]|nr:Fe-S cluster assembly protein SufD [Gammaproteobacteria bacterium]